ncbi:hypothetical protein [Deinococcus soli (ex Cha et al. 2016)]|uniref:Uncharacterized protein n=2 Tax=Deinococcus soli (ex Cha et al. 2016) TaxID=1309411 RepID=A0ACC6KGV2_9DEIO|nr:hypothetical protein [Deinococcus soli (ex Cha et al. 2016)]MDR6218963.1 hypothetical protein [Deinococcus soli (ex Cha et al. 2016)]MDR6328760.1 hypothetical protein [Deinococcus soli (ex Cha et al. 2016)]MDR6751753.1 hypothetical protein [Deinococcus soli (ex Cha et al. 2016)]
MTLDAQIAAHLLGWTQVTTEDDEHPGETVTAWSAPDLWMRRLPRFSGSLDACAQYVERALRARGDSAWAAYGARLAARCAHTPGSPAFAASLATLSAEARCQAALEVICASGLP